MIKTIDIFIYWIQNWFMIKIDRNQRIINLLIVFAKIIIKS